MSPRPSSIRQSLGERTEAIVTATKSMTGHLLGGAGALESLATLLALYHRKVTPTINLDNPEPDLGIDIATKVRDLPSGDLRRSATRLASAVASPWPSPTPTPQEA